MEVVRVTVLASGSSGNATLFASATTRVLVDAGIGPRALEDALVAAGEQLPDAIVVTHAHLDHVGHAARIAKRRRIPVYLTEAASREIALPSAVEEYRFESREPFAIGDLVLEPLPVPHDAANVALKISDDTGSAALATDVGEPTAKLLELLRDCDVVLLESNYEDELLARGPYPWSLKQRVASARGHLSNRQAHAILSRLGPRPHTVVLVHLSERNNDVALATASARDALGDRVRVHAAPPRGTLSIDADAEPWRRTRRATQLALF